MKKTTILLTLLLCLMFLTGAARAADADYTYTVDVDGYLTITGYSGAPDSDGRLEIPAALYGTEVRRIDGAFQDRTDLRTVILPEGLQGLIDAFNNCTSLEAVYIPGTLETTKRTEQSPYTAPFSGCSGLKRVEFGLSIPKVPALLFEDCTGLTEISIPERATVIEHDAFRGCTNLTSVTFQTPNEYLTTIEAGAFRDCVSLPAVILPEGLRTLGDNAFAGCTALTAVTIPATLRTSGSSQYPPFNGCSALCDVTFGKDVREIPAYLFKTCGGLKEIAIPDTVRTIGAGAFETSGLTAIDVPDNVTAYGEAAFRNCAALKTARLSAGADTISAEMFANCAALESVSAAGNANMGGGAFAGCYGLKSFAAAGSGSIGERAFFQCYQLESAVLSGGVTSVGTEAFYECKRLTEIPLGSELTSIGSRAFYRCETLSGVELPEGLTTIGANAFQYDERLNNVVLPDTLTEIPAYAFANCTALTDISIPKSVTGIGDYAFFQDTGLLRVFLPASVTSIGEEAFSYVDIMTVEGVKGSYAETWALENDALEFVDKSKPVTSVKLAGGMDSMILPRQQAVAPVFVVEPEDTTDVLTLESADPRVLVRNGNVLYSQSGLSEPVTVTATATSGYRYTFTVTAFDATGIEIANLPEKTGYTVGESMDWSGFVLNAVYRGGGRERIFNDSPNGDALYWTASGFDSSTAGEKTVTVTYGGFTASFPVQVYASAEDVPVTLQAVVPSDGAVTVRLNGLKAGKLTLFVTAYSAEGTFAGIAEKTPTEAEIRSGSVLVPLDISSAATVKAVLLDAENQTPVSAARKLSLT